MTGSSSDGEHVRRIKSTALDSPSELPGWEVSFWPIVVRHERRLSAWSSHSASTKPGVICSC